MLQKLLALSGLLAPILFIAAVLLAASTVPGYDHISQLISGLGLTPAGIWFNPVVSLTGLLMIAFALGFHRGLKPGSRIGPFLLGVSGLGIVLVGLFPCALDCFSSLTGQVHVFGALGGGVIGILGTFAIAPRIKHDPRWRSFYRFTIFIAVITALLLASMFFVPAEYQGLIQRLTIDFPFLYMFIVSIKLFRQN